MNKLFLRAGLLLCGVLGVGNVLADVNTSCSLLYSSPKAAEISKSTTAASTVIQINMLTGSALFPMSIGGWGLGYGPIPKTAATSLALTACTKNGAPISLLTTAVPGDVISCPIAALPAGSTGIEVGLFDTTAGVASGAGIIDIHQYKTACTAGTGTYWKPPTGALGCAPTLRATACTTGPVPQAWYQMEESAWTGAAGEVIDSSLNVRHATASTSGATTGSTASWTTSAIAGNPGTCSFGVFDGTNGYVSLPATFPDLTTDFTITGWIRTTDNTQIAQRVLVDDQNNTGGYGLSLGEGGTGVLRFYARGTTPIILDTPLNTIQNDTWYFVAAVANITAMTKTLYVYDQAGTLVSSVSQTITGTWGTDAGTASIAGENNLSAESSYHFKGNLDEVAVYSGALTTTQLATIRSQTHACTSGIHHVAISAPATALTLNATPVTITQHNAAHALLASGGTISLSTSTGRGDWSIGSGTGTLAPGAANSGLATYTFGPGESSVTLDFTYQSAATVTLNVKDVTGVDLLLNTSAGEKANTITFTAPSFVFTNGSCVNGKAFGAAGQTCTVATWSPQVAGQNSGNVFITAVNATGVPTALSTSKARTRNMQFGLSCYDPVANAGVQAAFAGVTLLLCQANGATPAAWSATTVTVTFNMGVPSSAASYAFNYADVGEVELWMRNSATTSQVGSSGVFVVKPGGFALSNIVRTSDSFANPAAANAAGAVFVRAGEAFSATVKATTCTPASATCTVAGATTPNYGNEVAPESVKLTSTLVAPAGGNNPVIAGTFGAFGAAHPSGTPAAVAGVAHGTAFTWDEVGIITLTPSVGDGDYLGAGDVTGTTTGNVGRFYPNHFDTAVVATATTPMPCPTGLTCPTSYNGFVYSGQPFSVKVTAKNLGGGTTANYAGAFSKAVTLSAWDALGGTTQNPGSGSLANNIVRAGKFSAGIYSDMLSGTVDVTSGSTTVSGTGTSFLTQLAAGDAINISGVDYIISAITDDVTLALTTPYAAANGAGLNVYVRPSYALAPVTAPTDIFIRAKESSGTDNVTSLRTTPSASVEGGVKVASGRVKISNAHGSELLPLPMTATVQYYNGTLWVTSTTDSATSLTLAATYNVLNKQGTTTGTTTPTPTGAATVSAGTLPFRLSAPTGGAGRATVSPVAPAYLPLTAGLATFGVYKGNNEFIYLRENY